MSALLSHMNLGPGQGARKGTGFRSPKGFCAELSSGSESECVSRCVFCSPVAEVTHYMGARHHDSSLMIREAPLSRADNCSEQTQRRFITNSSQAVTGAEATLRLCWEVFINPKGVGYLAVLESNCSHIFAKCITCWRRLKCEDFADHLGLGR